MRIKEENMGISKKYSSKLQLRVNYMSVSKENIF